MTEIKEKKPRKSKVKSEPIIPLKELFPDLVITKELKKSIEEEMFKVLQDEIQKEQDLRKKARGL